MKYPSVDGLAINPNELGYFTPTNEQIYTGGLVEMHHRYHFSRWYDPESDGYGAWRQVFRNLEVNIDPLLTGEHNKAYRGSLHERYSPPAMPKDVVMIDFVEQELYTNGMLLLHNFRRSMPPKVMSAAQWSATRKRYRGNKK